MTSDNSVLLRQLAGELAHSDWAGDLQRPNWPVYLGRKACVPSRPIFDGLTSKYRDLEQALRGEPWDRVPLKSGQPSKLEAWIECADGDNERQDAMRLNDLRFYDFRRCRRIEIEAASLPRGTA